MTEPDPSSTSPHSEEKPVPPHDPSIVEEVTQAAAEIVKEADEWAMTNPKKAAVLGGLSALLLAHSVPVAGGFALAGKALLVAKGAAEGYFYPVARKHGGAMLAKAREASAQAASALKNALD